MHHFSPGNAWAKSGKQVGISIIIACWTCSCCTCPDILSSRILHHSMSILARVCMIHALLGISNYSWRQRVNPAAYAWRKQSCSAFNTSPFCPEIVRTTRCSCCTQPKSTSAQQALIMNAAMLSARQKFPLYISQDGNQSGIAELARNHAPAIFHLQHVEADNFLTRKKKEPVAYYRIASHYRFIMQQFFDCWQYPKLIVLEVCPPLLHATYHCECHFKVQSYALVLGFKLPHMLLQLVLHSSALHALLLQTIILKTGLQSKR